MPLSLLDTDKPACEGTNKRDFFFLLHAHLQRSSEAAKRNLPWTSWTVKGPSACCYELQSRRPGAPNQVPEIICTIYEANNNSILCHITYSGLSVGLCFILGSKSLGRLQLGDTKSTTILYLDRHDNQNAVDGGIISLCLLAHSAHYIFCFDLLRLQMFPWSLSATHS